MKKTFSILLVLTFSIAALAQNDSLDVKKKELEVANAEMAAAKAKIDGLNLEIKALTPAKIWAKGGFAGVTFNSLGLSNWVAGGVSSNSIAAFGNIFRNYKKDKIEWVNNLDVAYGFIQNEGSDIRKNDDRIDLLSKAGYGITPKLNYSALLNFKSQFAPGFDYSDETIADADRVEISNFLAPATILASTGFEYKLNDFLSIYLSPATGKFTIVNDDSIAVSRTYIPGDKDEQGNFYYDQNFRPEFGAFFNATLKKDLGKRISIKSTLDLFNNLTDANKDNRLNTDIDWITDVNMKLTKFLDAKIFTNVKYDHNQILATEAALGKGPKTQFQRLFGLGFMYKF
ncbi:MAG: hypothetical protein COA58_12480 [Bacteroidetes bacterium]|nr:MAG: hypothetical protein COA58_12480 [Bacteroidota bacterium]